MLGTNATPRRTNLNRRLAVATALYATAIYGLVDPRTNELRYVGKTIQPLEDRLRLHLNDAQKIKRRHVCTWLRKLKSEGTTPEIFEIDRAGDDWCEREQFWIAYFRSIGSRLTNQTIGGEGAAGRQMSDEARAKMRGRVQSAESRRKISEAAKRQHADPITQARWLEAMKHLKVPQEVRDRKAQWNRDNADRIKEILNRPDVKARRSAAISAGKLKPEARVRASESQRLRHINNPLSPETRARIGELQKFKVVSQETRRKMSESAKNRRRRERETTV